MPVSTSPVPAVASSAPPGRVDGHPPRHRRGGGGDHGAGALQQHDRAGPVGEGPRPRRCGRRPPAHPSAARTRPRAGSGPPARHACGGQRSAAKSSPCSALSPSASSTNGIRRFGDERAHDMPHRRRRCRAPDRRPGPGSAPTSASTFSAASRARPPPGVAGNGRVITSLPDARAARRRHRGVHTRRSPRRRASRRGSRTSARRSSPRSRRRPSPPSATCARPADAAGSQRAHVASSVTNRAASVRAVGAEVDPDVGDARPHRRASAPARSTSPGLRAANVTVRVGVHRRADAQSA